MIHFGEDIWVCMIVVSIINAILSLVGLFVSAFGAFKASRDVSHISETTSLGYNSQLTKSPKKQSVGVYFWQYILIKKHKKELLRMRNSNVLEVPVDQVLDSEESTVHILRLS